ncbi:MAG: serine dehydratase subunit alpha family protein, partial [Clostridia bacterium]|nr:serine dehydratase subunit alpha family protein [Clostridia bacterium]
MDEIICKSYIDILNEELLPAMGCTEPISVAYAAALARKTLGCIPDRVEISVSGNILKNVKSVIVPNTGGLKGIAAAAAAGIVAGREENKLQVLEGITESEQAEIAEYLNSRSFKVNHSDSGCVFDIGIKVYSGGDSAFVRIEGYHTNVVAVERNGERLVWLDGERIVENKLTDRSVLNVKDIIEFVNSVDISEVEPLITRQIEYNCAIAEEGLKNDYGARVGKVLLASFGDSVS